MAHIEKGRFVHKIIILITFIITTSTGSKGQHWKPEFKIPLDSKSIHTQISDLNDYLQFGFPLVANNCASRLSLFNFRVNSLGQVDSVYSEGNFRTDENALIIKNIKTTSGNWILPKNTKISDNCWFVYPCYIVGEITQHCRDVESHVQSILMLRATLAKVSFQFDNLGRYILPPNKYSYNIKK